MMCYKEGEYDVLEDENKQLQYDHSCMIFH